MASMWPVTILFALGLGAAWAQPVARPYVSLGAGLDLQQDEAQAAPGFRYALFQPARSMPAALPTVFPQAPSPGRRFPVFFDWDSAELSQRGRQVIAEAARASARERLVRVQVNGYTDASCTPGYNHSLSVRRALSVRAELLRDGMGAGEVGIRGLAGSLPYVPAGAGPGGPHAHRVDIIVQS